MRECFVNSLLQIISSMFIGGLLGVGVSFVDCCILYEIAVNQFYAIYFSLFFLLIALFILSKSYRSYNSNFQNPDFIQVEEAGNALRYKVFLLLGIMILMSSAISVLLHRSFVVKMNYLVKVPLFAVLGIGVTFALTVTLIDLVNLFMRLVRRNMTKPVINSAKQIVPIICITSVMGMLFGGVFGELNMEDASIYSFAMLLQKEQYYCLPISLIAGALSGLVVSYDFKHEEGEEKAIANGFKPLSQEEEV